MALTLVQAHAITMILSVMTFGSIGIYMARYGRMLRIGTGRQLLGKALWFQIHRFFLTVSSLLMILGFLFIFVRMRGQWADPNVVNTSIFIHTVFGGIILCGFQVQIWLALYRCNPNSRYRFLFDWSHRITGLLTFILSMPTFILATSRQPRNSMALTIIISLWIGWLTIFVIICESIDLKKRITITATGNNAGQNRTSEDHFNANVRPETETGASIFLVMDISGPNGNVHHRGTHHQHDEVRLIDYARLCEHLSSRKIILLQLFRTILRRLNHRYTTLKEDEATRHVSSEFTYTEDVLLPSFLLFLTRNFEWELPNLMQHLTKVYPNNDLVNEYSQSVAKLAQATLVDIIDLFHDLSKFIQKRGESNFNNENQAGHASDKVHYTIKGWSLVGLFLRRHLCSFEMLSTPHLEQLVNDVSRYVDSYIRSSIFKCPLSSKDNEMIVESESTDDIKAYKSIRELKIQTKQYSSSDITIPASIKQAEYMLTKLAVRLDAGILIDDYELEILRSIEKIYPQLSEAPFVHYLHARSKNNYSQANYYLHHYFDKQNGFQLTSDIGALHMSTLLSHYNFKNDANKALSDGMSMSLLRSEKDIMPLCVDQLIASTLNASEKVDNLLLFDNRFLKQLDNSSVGLLSTDDCVCVENWPSVQLMSRGNLPAVLQRIDIDFERTDVKSRFNWINRAAVHYLNKTAFWNLAQYNDFVLLYSAMVLDNSEHLHFRHTNYYALACSYLSMALLNQGQYNLASQMLNKSVDLVQLSTNAHNLIDMARADVQFILQCRRNEWDRALITAKTFSNYSQIEYEIRRTICLHNLNELDDSQRDPVELQKLLNPEKVSDLISRIKLLLLLTENCAKKNDLVPSLGFLEECKQLCVKYHLQYYLILCRLYEVQLNKSNLMTPQECIRILSCCLTELLKYSDRYNAGRCALLLGRLYLLEIAEDRAYPNYLSEAEHLLLLAKDIFTCFHEFLYLKLTYLYLVFTYHDSAQVEKRKQMAKLYKQIDVKLDTKPVVI